jgi:23S rRNA pseudouridine1911/1915/1917 synthase
VKLSHRVPEEAGQARIDRYLADALGISRARIKEAFDAGNVRVDGKRVSKGARISPGSEITTELPDTEASPKPQPELPLKVLLEDPVFLVLDKPAGMPVHPLREGELGTLANALVARYPECAQASADPREGGLAHRLDVETSGAIVAARSRETYEKLRATFTSRHVGKRYLALVGGAPGEGGEIDIPIAHHPKSPKRMLACADEEEAQRLKAREAVTRYRVLERLGDFALVEAEIPTGVMHQIRVHLAAIGAPVAGDALYGGPEIPGLTRQFLHAQRIELPHPVSGEPVIVESPLPPELEAVLQKLRAARG